jgi:hypothetical protein
MQDHIPYWRRYSKRFGEWQWARDNVIVAAAMAILVLIVAYWRYGKFDKQLALAVVWAYGALAISYLFYQGVKTVLVVDKDRGVEYRDVAHKVARLSETLENERRIKELPNKVDIEVEIKEIIVQVGPSTARCFVDVYLHNSESTEITIPEYRITLFISGKEFQSSTLLDVSSILAADMTADLDEIGPDGPRFFASETKPISDIRVSISDLTPLVAGKPKRGWLGFQVTALPAWPTYETVIGTTTEYDNDREPYEYEEKQTTLLDRTLTDYIVAVKDPHGRWHSSKKMPYKKNWHREVFERLKG